MFVGEAKFAGPTDCLSDDLHFDQLLFLTLLPSSFTHLVVISDVKPRVRMRYCISEICTCHPGFLPSVTGECGHSKNLLHYTNVWCNMSSEQSCFSDLGEGGHLI